MPYCPLTISYHVISYHVISYHIISCHHIISYLIISYWTLWERFLQTTRLQDRTFSSSKAVIGHSSHTTSKWSYCDTEIPMKTGNLHFSKFPQLFISLSYLLLSLGNKRELVSHQKRLTLLVKIFISQGLPLNHCSAGQLWRTDIQRNSWVFPFPCRLLCWKELESPLLSHWSKLHGTRRQVQPLWGCQGVRVNC